MIDPKLAAKHMKKNKHCGNEEQSSDTPMSHTNTAGTSRWQDYYFDDSEHTFYNGNNMLVDPDLDDDETVFPPHPTAIQQPPLPENEPIQPSDTLYAEFNLPNDPTLLDGSDSLPSIVPLAYLHDESTPVQIAYSSCL